jgi:hypothetical protein
MSYANQPRRIQSAALAQPQALPHVAGESVPDYQTELARLRAENDQLRQAKAGHVGTMKVSEKGGVSVYGLGRFPVTLYREQWIALLDAADKIRAFIRANDHLLSRKN